MNDKTPDRSPDKAEPKHEPMRSGPDMMTPEELVTTGGSEQYAYRDQTRTVADLPLGAQGDGLSSAVLNPAYYPKGVKPEALHTEAEKAGAEYPEGPIPGEVPDQSAKGTDFPASRQSEPVGLAKVHKQ